MTTDDTARDRAIEAGAKALAADRGLDLDNLAAHGHPGEGPSAIAAWRANWIEDGRIAYDAMAPIIRQAVAEEIATALQARSGKTRSSWSAAAEVARRIGGAS